MGCTPSKQHPNNCEILLTPDCGFENDNAIIKDDAVLICKKEDDVATVVEDELEAVVVVIPQSEEMKPDEIQVEFTATDCAEPFETAHAPQIQASPLFTADTILMLRDNLLKNPSIPADELEASLCFLTRLALENNISLSNTSAVWQRPSLLLPPPSPSSQHRKSSRKRSKISPSPPPPPPPTPASTPPFHSHNPTTATNTSDEIRSWCESCIENELRLPFFEPPAGFRLPASCVTKTKSPAHQIVLTLR
eukprot:c3864_g1_i1.p1 GENE.c3864_g1_i1~~c3864_g1_i1.p1  ORF type:complete len:267 (+),score=34.20 c3864_g1_i1:54-803(+)